MWLIKAEKIYSGRHACLTKENVTDMLHASRRHHLCLWSTMHILTLYSCWQSKLNHSRKIIRKCYVIITNCDSLVYYKVRWTVITNCNTFFITKCDTVYYKLRQVLQCAMDLLQIATGITKCDDYYKLRQYRLYFRFALKITFRRAWRNEEILALAINGWLTRWSGTKWCPV